MKSKILTIIVPSIAAVAVAAALMSGLHGSDYFGSVPVSEVHAAPGGSVASVAQETPGNRATLPDFAEIAAQQGAAVVNISVSGTAKPEIYGMPGFPQIDPNDPLFEFFRRFQIPAPGNGVPVRGFGSGFIVSPDGVILTNAHVVADADEVTVRLTDRREFKAKVKGIDKPSDVAVLKIDAKNLPVVKIGDPQKSRVGDWVLAIGSPFGFENSVTAGIISAKSRSLPDENYVPFLQTDVAVNPGNSGGPLFNANGEVIGINSQIYSRSGGYQGLSFAIPIDVAMKVERQLIEHGKVSRGRLGITIQEVGQQLAETFGLDKPYGALVSSVEKGSPAEKAGIEPGDVILKFNGKEVTRSADLPPMVSEVAPGSMAKLSLWRKGKAREITLTVGEMKMADAKGKGSKHGNEKLGMAIRPLTPEERSQAEASGGLVVEQVDPTGPAARAGIQPRDIILSVNGEEVQSVEQLQTLIAKHGKRIALLIMRNDHRLFVPFSPG